MQALFRTDRTRLVGGLGAGEMLFEVSSTALRLTAAQAAAAEEVTRVRTRETNGRTITFFDPSRRRSEVGAIESVELASTGGKWDFPLESALAALQLPGACGAYIIETYLPLSEYLADIPSTRTRTFAALLRALQALRFPIQLGLVSPSTGTLGVRPTIADERFDTTARLPTEARIELSPARHNALLQTLDSSPVIKRISLPTSFETAEMYDTSILGTEFATFNSERAIESYPVVGIVDSGISDTLAPWVIWRHDYIDAAHLEPDHGTKVASIAFAGGILNPHLSLDAGPCRLVDIPLYLQDAALKRAYFPGGAEQLLDEMASAIAEAKERFNVRIFNLSMNSRSQASLSYYSDLARKLDDIADTFDVLIVCSAGNLRGAEERAEWPADHERALAIIASGASENLLVPAEAIRGLAVGAINPPGAAAFVSGALANYSRRGPVLQGVSKPDLCHFGGCGSQIHTGVNAVDAHGYILAVSGTSFSAPFVSRLFAELDWQTRQALSTQSLIALVIHSAKIEAPLDHRAFRGVAQHLVGCGLPQSASEILTSSNDELTLIFEGTLGHGQSLVFDFNWPRGLADAQGSCRGDVRLTIVARPFLNYQYGAELSRVEVSASLQQAKPAGGYIGRLTAGSPDDGDFAFETELIDESKKWGPIKRLDRQFRGIGTSTSWRLRVNSLLRLEETIPERGVPFSVVLTIGAENSNIFNELRSDLGAIGTRLVSVRDVIRVR
ncbi:MAG TPA: S8 family peptidase [Candidatus Elarobacter sp.]|nr:S8 family peptidase [Candidatus Elarobacter sp.]